MRAESKKQEVTLEEMAAVQAELDEVRRAHGITVEEGRLSGLISRFFDKRQERKKQLVNRKKYVLLAVFTGWMGGHRFYAKRYPLAILYLLLFWTGFPFAMTLVDLMAAIPIPADENGNIRL